jgi:hypothetical protein
LIKSAHFGKWLLVLLAILPLLYSHGIAQSQRRNVEGTVLDSARHPLDGVSVRLTSLVDTITTTTDSRGKFSFSGILSREFKLTFSMLGYRMFDQQYMVESNYNVLHILPVVIYPMHTLLDVVQVSRIPPFIVKGDTVQYNMDAYQFSRTTLLEGALKVLPNVQVHRDGTVFAFGKRVNRVQVDGKNFFGGDVLTATRNLHVNLIKSVQVIDYHGDLAQATGIKGGETEKILNIILHEDKKKILFGQVTGGGGSKDRYIGSAGINHFNDGQEFSVVTSTNNTNTSLFSYGAPTGAGGFEREGTELANIIDPLDGLNQVNSIGVSFSDQINSNLELYGRYSFVHKKNQTLSDLYSQNGFYNYLIENFEEKESFTNQKAHSMSWDVDGNLSRGSYFKISPSVSFSNTDLEMNSFKTIRNRLVTTEGEYGTIGEHRTPNLGTEFLYVKPFKKPGRKIVVNGNFEMQRQDRLEHIGDYLVIIDSAFAQPNIDIYSLLQESKNDHRHRAGKVRAAFVENIHEHGIIEFSYEKEYTGIISNRIVTDLEENHLIDSLNLDYHYSFKSDRYGLRYQVDAKKQFNYSVGLAAQPLLIEGLTMDGEIRTKHAHFNWVPTANMRFKPSNNSEVSIDYLGRHQQPSFVQMQPVRDLSNSQYIIVGNPDLKSEFMNRLTARYRKSRMSRSSFFEVQLAYSSVNDKIVSNRRTSSGSTAIENAYLNADGYFDLRSYYLYSTLLGSDQFQINFNGNADYIHNITYTNDFRNTTKHLILSQAAQIRFAVEDRVQLELNGNFMLNQTQSPLYTFSNIRATSWVVGMAGRTYFTDHLSVGFDISHRTNAGYNPFINSNPTILNSYLEYTFMSNRRAMIRIHGFDLFNQNTGITKEVFDTMDLSVRNNRLGRHFMISMNIRLQRQPQQT